MHMCPQRWRISRGLVYGRQGRAVYEVITSARIAERRRQFTAPDEGQDERLDVKVTMDVRGKTLSQVLMVLSQQTKVEIEADHKTRG